MYSIEFSVMRYARAVTAITLMLFDPVISLPNIIVMQPDDMLFYNDWGSPPNNPATPNKVRDFPALWNMPNIERLRTDGLWMKQAYAASAMCGTSRFSTLTGRYASRSSYGRAKATARDEDFAFVTIPTTKLTDVGGQNDCSEENLAAAFQASGLYRTGMFGKWHLTKFDEPTYTYSDAQTLIEGCGFDYVDGLYVENLATEPDLYNNFHDGSYSHNMEWVTQTAIEFINNKDDTWDDKPFFMYFNPTVPHTPGAEAALDIPCTNTANTAINPIEEPSDIKGMTLEKGGCGPYRDYVKSRGASDNEYGAIWVDDSVGAIYQALEDKGILNNTIILFQLDHGQESKSAIYENGVRIAQFVHYPDGIPANSEFEGLVSTIDVAPTMLDFAGISATYSMDGQSWKDAINDADAEEEWRDERCLFFELDKDKAVRCGCNKYLEFYEDITSGTSYGKGVKLGYSVDLINLFDMCDGGTSYATDKTKNMEALDANEAVSNSCRAKDMSTVLQCHVDRIDYREDPDYTTCNFIDTCSSSAPTKASSSSSSAPTISPVDCKLRGMISHFFQVP